MKEEKKERLEIVPVLPEEQLEFIPKDPLLETSLSREIETENSIKSVSKELFSHKDIDVKTDVSHNDINNITRLRAIDNMWPSGNIEIVLRSLLSLRLSKNRKSRSEFIAALNIENRNAQQGGFLNTLLGRNGGGNP